MLAKALDGTMPILRTHSTRLKSFQMKISEVAATGESHII
jgi:hypothetical protein